MHSHHPVLAVVALASFLYASYRTIIWGAGVWREFAEEELLE